MEIPNSWCWIRLNNLCNITNGFTPLRTEPKFWENGNINWFTVEDIRKQGEYIYQTTQKITELAVSKDRIVRAGSVLLCCTASVGQCAMTMIPTTTNQQFNALTIKEEYRCLVNDEFLYLFVKTLAPILHDLAGKTTFEFISVKKVGNILVPIPPVLEQCRICKVTNKAIASIMSR
ncbi:restriction endonuclease subunit S [Bacteroides fragilis]